MFCFFITDIPKDNKRKGSDILQWNTRSHKKFNATSERAAKSLTEIRNRRHSLVFKNARSVNDDNLLLPNHPGTDGFICVPFRTSSDHEQTLLSNFETILFLTKSPLQTHKSTFGVWKMGKEKWVLYNTSAVIGQRLLAAVAVAAVAVAAEHQAQLTYIINDDPKLSETFTFDSIEEMTSGCAVGSRYDGGISSIEMYYVKGNPPPQSLKDLVIKNQLI